MKRSLVLRFGSCGYAIGVCNYLYFGGPFFAAVQHLIWYGCPSCSNVTRVGGPPWLGILLAIAPANALIYAAGGVLIGWLYKIGCAADVSGKALV
jgi:hypothetical protein